MPQETPLRPRLRGPARAALGGGDAARAPSSRAAAAPAQATAAQRHVEETVYAAISKALLEGKLRPGTPLRERYLAEVFGATRGAVRKVLLRLGNEGRLQMLPNRGAYVPEPSRADIQGVYDARKAVEAGLVALLASRITDAALAHLRAHVRNERRAHRQGRRDESVKLAGDFHLELVRALGNTEIEAILARLVARTQMFVALYESSRDSGCAPDEHEAIMAALATRDAGAAVTAMLAHLQQVEDRVTAHLHEHGEPDLGSILRSALPDAEAAA